MAKKPDLYFRILRDGVEGQASSRVELLAGQLMADLDAGGQLVGLDVLKGGNWVRRPRPEVPDAHSWEI